MENVAVLGATTAAKLFPFDDPLGQSVRVGPNFYRVVGVVKDRMPTGGTGGSQAAEDFNNDVYIPLNTCKVRFGENIFLRPSGSRSGEQVRAAPDHADRRRHGQRPAHRRGHQGDAGADATSRRTGR